LSCVSLTLIVFKIKGKLLNTFLRKISKMFALIGQYRFSVQIQMETRFLQFEIFALHESFIIFNFIYSVTKTLVLII
jgi:hypothetical protein